MYTLVIHGGAGTIVKEDMTPELEKAYLEGLQDAVDAGFAVLEEGGTSVNAVKAALVLLEDHILFNAGRGAVFTKKGVQEMDAAIMEGKSKKAGAVASTTVIKNPIAAARAVMEKTRHVLLVGAGADQFAKDNRLEIVQIGRAHV